jgi:autotransporter-associated beta strand protein
VAVALEAPTGSGIASITVPNPAAKYYTAPTVIIFGDGTGASAVVGYDELSYTVTNVTVTSAGCGYTTATAYLFLYEGKCVALEVTLGANAATGGLTKKGAGTLTLSGANTYGGDTVVEAGTLKFASASALPAGSSVISKGGAVGAPDYADVPKTITLDATDLVDGQRYVLAAWDDGTPGAIEDFAVTGLPAGWSLQLRAGKLVASHFRGTTFTVR